MLKKAKPYLISIAIALGVGLLSSFFTRDAMTRFETLKKPPLAPPGSVFPIVWSVLFVLMGISIFEIRRHRQKGRPLIIYRPAGCQFFLDYFFLQFGVAPLLLLLALAFVRTGNRNDRKILKGF